ncbi:MAG: phasin family protein [Sphingomonas sp.]|nr:phasin family protein [Sphingomonas sp.]
MTADTNTPVDAAADAAKAQGQSIAEATKTAARTGEKAAKTASKAATKTVRKSAKAARKSSSTTARKSTKSRRKAKTVRAKAQPVRNERNDSMTFNPTSMFAGFGAFPASNAFEKMFTEASGRGEETVKRSRKAAEEFADIYRANVDAFAEAGRIAATGAQSIGQDIASKSRDSLEQTANSVRSFAEAKSPTELLQLQSDFARSAFDRFVEDSSAMTESFVKIAGEAFQPISNRTSANVEKLNKIAA